MSSGMQNSDSITPNRIGASPPCPASKKSAFLEVYRHIPSWPIEVIACKMRGMNDAHLVFLILGATLVAFIYGRLRYDLVALLSLLACVLFGLVDPTMAFYGFGHPAVITVAAVLVLSRGFQQAGLVDLIAGQALRVGGSITLQVLVLTATVAVLSAFMNNVGALALLMPVAIRIGREHGIPPSRLLMPLAFGSLLGGLMTLIGTPPNIIIASYRMRQTGEAFGMFDFLPVGGIVALAGVVFLVILGWRLTPTRKGQSSPDELFETADYIGELEVVEGGKAVGLTLNELTELCGEPIPILAVIRGKQRRPGHSFHSPLKEGDILLVEAETDEIKLLEEKGGLKIGNSEDFKEKLIEAKDLQLVEAVVRADSRLAGRSVADLRLIDRHNMQLLAVARSGSRVKQRISKVRLQTGDVLLLQGEEKDIGENLADLGCLPLADRKLTIGQPRRLILAVSIFVAAIVAMLLGWLPAAVALTLAAVLSIVVGVLPLREAYSGIDWPIIVLLGALIPVGGALEHSGGASMIADTLLATGANWPPLVALALLFVATQLLSNVINNAAAAVLMAPIAVILATGFDASPDPFLMAVAVSASCAFLTPIGHQSNTLVMGPGGYRFSDYWKVGLPLTALVIAVAIPAILMVWPM